MIYSEFLKQIYDKHLPDSTELVKSLKNGSISEEQFINIQIMMMNMNETYPTTQYSKDWNISDFNMKTSYKKYTDEEKIDWIERNTPRGSWTFCDDDDKISEFNHRHKLI